MTPFFKTIRWILWKDLIIELRCRETIASMVFFALIVILIFSFSFSMDQQAAHDVLAGMIWVAFAFTGMIGLGKSFSAELQNDCLEALQMAPVSRGTLYLGKVAANFAFMFVVEILLFPMFVILFNVDIVEDLSLLLVVFLLATAGLASVGTLFAALTVHIRAREVMLPILLLPMVVPVMIAAVEATKGALNGDPLSLYRPWLELLAIFDVVFTIVSFWMFDFVMDA